MIGGGCLCGAVRFELARAVGPFELCHCSRCRKATGSAFAAMLGVRTADYRMTRGRELVAAYAAPILDGPPAYRAFFCRDCGSPVPDPAPSGSWFEVPAGSLDDDPGVRPDRHIYVEHRAAWFAIEDSLPQSTKAEVAEHRRRTARGR